MNIFSLLIRSPDIQGAGHFGASRGSRKHNGIDLVLPIGSSVFSPINGAITKVGYPYRDPDKKHIRYVEITKDSYKYRVFYICPKVEVGDVVTTKDIIGISQELGNFYKGITEHIHLEIKDITSKYIDPTPMYLTTRDQLGLT